MEIVWNSIMQVSLRNLLQYQSCKANSALIPGHRETAFQSLIASINFLVNWIDLCYVTNSFGATP